MLKPTLLNILIFWLAKYFVLYVLLMLKNNNYVLLKINEIKNEEDLFYYLWLFLFLPIVSMILFSTPLYFSFKVKGIFSFLLIIFGVLILEYISYTWLASQSDFTNGFYNGIICVILILVLFYKKIPKFSKTIGN